MERILVNSHPDRFSIFPILYDDIWKMYKTQEANMWIAGEIKYQEDLNDWNTKLTDDERHFTENVLAFFAVSDGIVAENISMNFTNEIQILEAKFFYALQGHMENVHNETYSLLIDTFCRDSSRKEALFNSIRDIPCITSKISWIRNYIDPRPQEGVLPFAKRLIAFAIVEGVFFSGSFCAIFWLKSRNLMVNALGHSNELISRDEALHCEFAILLYTRYIENKISQEEVYEMMDQAVEIESSFIAESIPRNMMGMNADLMKDYIKFVADRLLQQLGYEKFYNSKNPFPFMDSMNLPRKSNFFETAVAEYRKAGSVTDGNSLNFKQDDDF